MYRYIVNFVGASHVTGKLCICTELLERGTVFDLIHKAKVSLVLKVKMAHDTACALAFLHKNGVLYRDLKPDNLMVFSVSHSARFVLVVARTNATQKKKKNQTRSQLSLVFCRCVVSRASCPILVRQLRSRIPTCRNATPAALARQSTWFALCCRLHCRIHINFLLLALTRRQK
jgi:serine/threonine protein kinase